METAKPKLVLFHGLSQDEAVKAMRAVKAATGDAAGIAFATSTPTNMGWKLEDLVEHVWEEHRMMTET